MSKAVREQLEWHLKRFRAVADERQEAKVSGECFRRSIGERRVFF